MRPTPPYDAAARLDIFGSLSGTPSLITHPLRPEPNMGYGVRAPSVSVGPKRSRQFRVRHSWCHSLPYDATAAVAQCLKMLVDPILWYLPHRCTFIYTLAERSRELWYLHYLRYIDVRLQIRSEPHADLAETTIASRNYLSISSCELADFAATTTASRNYLSISSCELAQFLHSYYDHYLAVTSRIHNSNLNVLIL